MRSKMLSIRAGAAMAAAALGAGMLGGLGLLSSTSASAAPAGCAAGNQTLLYYTGATAPTFTSGQSITIYYAYPSGNSTLFQYSLNGGLPVTVGGVSSVDQPLKAFETCPGVDQSSTAHEQAFTFTPTGTGPLVITVHDDDGDPEVITLGDGGAGGKTDLTSFGTSVSGTGAGPFTDTATATGTAGTEAGTGATVSFFACPLAANGACPSGTAGRVAEGALIGPTTTGSTATFTSSAFTPPTPAAGTSQIWCFAADYSGNAKYKPTTDNDTSAASPQNECFTVSNGGGSGPGGGGGGASGASFLGTSRIGGADRIDTADLVSQASFATGTAGSVVLARSDLFPDSLAGTPLALAKNAPILITPPSSLDKRTATEMQRVLLKGGTVYLLGQTGALSSNVANSVTALGYTVVRIGGADRFNTAVDIANTVGGVTRIFLANGTNFPDALAAAAASGTPGTVIVLSDGTTLPAVTSSFMSAHSSATKYSIGGPAAAADPSVTQVVGADRYDTSVKVAQTFFTKPTGAGVATGLNFPDALTAGPFLAIQNWPMVLTDPSSLPSSISDYLTSIKPTAVAVDVFGGTAAVSDNVFNQIKAIFGG